MAIIIFIIFIATMLIGMPVFFAMGITSVFSFIILRITSFIQSKFPLLVCLERNELLIIQ